MQRELALYFRMWGWIWWGDHYHLKGHGTVAEAEFMKFYTTGHIFDPSWSKESSLKCVRKFKHVNIHYILYNLLMLII